MHKHVTMDAYIEFCISINVFFLFLKLDSLYPISDIRIFKIMLNF